MGNNTAPYLYRPSAKLTRRVRAKTPASVCRTSATRGWSSPLMASAAGSAASSSLSASS